MIKRLRQRCPFRHSVMLFVLRSSRNPLTLNQTGLVAVTLTKKAGLFSWVMPAFGRQVFDPNLKPQTLNPDFYIILKKEFQQKSDFFNKVF